MNPSKELIEAVRDAICQSVCNSEQRHKLENEELRWGNEAKAAIAAVMQSKEVRELVEAASKAQEFVVGDAYAQLVDALQPFTDNRG